MAATKKKTTVNNQTKVEKNEKVKAFMRMTWPGLGKVGDVIDLPEQLAKDYEALGVVDTSPAAIAPAKKA